MEGSVSENWRQWIQQFRLYSNATGRDKKSEEIQCSTLLTVAGEEAVEVYKTFDFPKEETNKTEILIKKFERYFTPKKNVTFERHVFNTRNQGTSEKIDSYVTEHRKLAKACEFAQLHDSLIKDRIVCGIKSDDVKARLLRENDLTLEKALNICRSTELSKTQLKNIVDGKPTAEQVAALYKKKEGLKKKAHSKSEQDAKADSYNCRKCGSRHGTKQCKAYGKKCQKCQKPNHFAKMCLASANHKMQSKVDAVNENSESSEDEFGFFIGAVDDGESKFSKEWNVELT